MGANLAATVSKLVQEVRHGRGALLMDGNGAPVERMAPGASAGLEAIAGEYASLLRQARSVVAELNWGAPKSLSVRGAEGQVIFAFAPKDLFVGVAAGPAGLRGQMRSALGRALTQIGDL
jgi:predicted regulator of Ras-like GTPase activity (Roadblock/LC7/MglB family)